MAIARVGDSTLVRIDGDVARARSTPSRPSFQLVDIKDKKVVLQGTSHARAGFERFQSIYSNVRARDDAENRAAKTIADDLKTRLATYLSRRGVSSARPRCTRKLDLAASGIVAALGPADAFMVADQDPSGRRVPQRARSRAAGRAVLRHRRRPGRRAGGAAGQGASPSATTRRARSCASTTPTSRTTPTASSSSCRPRRCSAAARSCAPRPGGA